MLHISSSNYAISSTNLFTLSPQPCSIPSSIGRTLRPMLRRRPVKKGPVVNEKCDSCKETSNSGGRSGGYETGSLSRAETAYGCLATDVYSSDVSTPTRWRGTVSAVVSSTSTWSSIHHTSTPIGTRPSLKCILLTSISRPSHTESVNPFMISTDALSCKPLYAPHDRMMLFVRIKV